MMGLDKPQLCAKFEVAIFVYYGNIRESIFKRQIRFEPPFGELVVTYALHPLLVEMRIVDFLFAIIELFC